MRSTLFAVGCMPLLGSPSTVRDRDINDIRFIVYDHFAVVCIMILRDIVFPPTRLNRRIKPRVPFIQEEMLMPIIPRLFIILEKRQVLALRIKSSRYHTL